MFLRPYFESISSPVVIFWWGFLPLISSFKYIYRLNDYITSLKSYAWFIFCYQKTVILYLKVKSTCLRNVSKTKKVLSNGSCLSLMMWNSWTKCSNETFSLWFHREPHDSGLSNTNGSSVGWSRLNTLRNVGSDSVIMWYL